MLSGKAVERAIRGHFLIDATLNAMLMSKVFHLSVIDSLEYESPDSPPNESESQKITYPEEETHETQQLLKMLTKMYI